jgi:ribosomal peptide maturation radical SAM protein 1
MPWPTLYFPSLALGLLKEVAKREGYSAASAHFFLSLVNYFARPGSPQKDLLTADEYTRISESGPYNGVGEWLFSDLVRPTDEAANLAYLEHLRRDHGASEEWVERLLQIRRYLPGFVEECAAQVLDHEPRAVGFTSAFTQNVASLALAKRLKELRPSVVTIFGGPNFDGPMGPAFHRAHLGIVDLVVRGEGEPRLPQILAAIRAGAPLPRIGGVTRSEGGRVEVVPESTDRMSLDDAVLPDYDEFFQTLRGGATAAIEPFVDLPVETSRGCWWGQKHHCTFCSFTKIALPYQAEPAERAYQKMMALSEKYRARKFYTVDSILDLSYLDTLMPRLAEAGLDFEIGYELKVNMSQRNVRDLARAGVRSVQPGIESLSTPVLKIIDKGVTALQNVRFLKWCRQYGVVPSWNFLAGFNGEPAAEYARMAEIAPALVHFEPPSGLIRIEMYRFSPNFERHQHYGYRDLRPKPWYGWVYRGLEATELYDLAFYFDYDRTDGGDLDRYGGELREVIELWKRDAAKNAGALVLERGPGFAKIIDRRTTMPKSETTLRGVEAQLYRSCHSGATPAALWKRLSEQDRAELPVEEIEAFLEELVERRLMFTEGGKYLSLAIPASDDLEENEQREGSAAAPRPQVVVG